MSLYFHGNRKAVKATVILFPLLGMAHILLFFKPHQLGEAWEMAYRVTHAIFQASQVSDRFGMSVSVGSASVQVAGI